MKKDICIEMPCGHCDEELTLLMVLETKDKSNILCKKCNSRTKVYYDKMKEIIYED